MSRLFKQLSGGTFDFSAADGDSVAGATAAGLVDQDFKLNQVDHFEDNNAVYDTRRGERDWGEYAVGSSTKRRVAKSRARAREVEIEGDQHMYDFNSKENPYYEDVHQGEYRKYAETETLSTAKKQKLAAGLKGLVEKRSKNATREPNKPHKGENVADFLARVKREDAAAAAAAPPSSGRDANDYQWILSGQRNQRDAATKAVADDDDEPLFPAAADDNGGGDADQQGIVRSDDNCVVAKVRIKASEREDWLEKRKRGADGEYVSEKKKKKESGDDDNEMTIRIPRSEIEHMQKLTEKLYGKAVGESEYVEEITDKLAGKAPSPDENLVAGPENLLIDETDYGDSRDDVQNYSKEWQRAADSDAKRNLAPDVDWSRTLYGRHSNKSCLRIDPYAFLTSQVSIDALMDDSKVHVQVECAIRKMKFNLPPERHVFFSVRDWSEKHLGTCDVIYYRYNMYSATVRRKSTAEAGAEPKTLAERLRSGASGQQQNEPEQCRRVVILHDMKNGFFVCNHFELVPKIETSSRESDKRSAAAAAADGERRAAEQRASEQRQVDDADNLKDRHKTSNAKHDFVWSGYCYLERLNDLR